MHCTITPRIGVTGQRLAFYWAWLCNPRRVGAIAPSSAAMAAEMANLVRPDSGLPVLELGPGTGIITQAILDRGVPPKHILSIERSAAFLPGLRQRFPRVNFINGDAFDITNIAASSGVTKFDAVVSALPLLTTSIGRRIALVEALLDLLAPGRPLIQFSYMWGPPVPAPPGRYIVRHLTSVRRNLPPARLWVYHRPAPN